MKAVVVLSEARYHALLSMLMEHVVLGQRLPEELAQLFVFMGADPPVETLPGDVLASVANEAQWVPECFELRKDNAS